jgi:hypothetical protein
LQRWGQRPFLSPGTATGFLRGLVGLYSAPQLQQLAAQQGGVDQATRAIARALPQLTHTAARALAEQFVQAPPEARMSFFAQRGLPVSERALARISDAATPKIHWHQAWWFMSQRGLSPFLHPEARIPGVQAIPGNTWGRLMDHIAIWAGRGAALPVPTDRLGAQVQRPWTFSGWFTNEAGRHERMAPERVRLQAEIGTLLSRAILSRALGSSDRFTAYGQGVVNRIPRAAMESSPNPNLYGTIMAKLISPERVHDFLQIRWDQHRFVRAVRQAIRDDPAIRVARGQERVAAVMNAVPRFMQQFFDGLERSGSPRSSDYQERFAAFMQPDRVVQYLRHPQVGVGNFDAVVALREIGEKIDTLLAYPMRYGLSMELIHQEIGSGADLVWLDELVRTSQAGRVRLLEATGLFGAEFDRLPVNAQVVAQLEAGQFRPVANRLDSIVQDARQGRMYLEQVGPIIKAVAQRFSAPIAEVEDVLMRLDSNVDPSRLMLDYLNLLHVVVRLAETLHTKGYTPLNVLGRGADGLAVLVAPRTGGSLLVSKVSWPAEVAERHAFFTGTLLPLLSAHPEAAIVQIHRVEPW